jgi:signal transduction histidine kinase
VEPRQCNLQGSRIEILRDCALEAEIRGCLIAVNGRLAGEVLGNRELLRRAVENVLRNGIRYSPENSIIEVSITEDCCAANIAVRDRGAGLIEGH